MDPDNTPRSVHRPAPQVPHAQTTSPSREALLSNLVDTQLRQWEKNIVRELLSKGGTFIDTSIESLTRVISDPETRNTIAAQMRKHMEECIEADSDSLTLFGLKAKLSKFNDVFQDTLASSPKENIDEAVFLKALEQAQALFAERSALYEAIRNALYQSASAQGEDALSSEQIRRTIRNMFQSKEHFLAVHEDEYKRLQRALTLLKEGAQQSGIVHSSEDFTRIFGEEAEIFDDALSTDTTYHALADFLFE